MDIKDPICQFLKEHGVPSAPDNNFPDSQLVFSFPVKAPEGAVTREQVTALEHLKLWKSYNDDYCEHKPSITVSVKDSEWPSVGAWVYENFDAISGIAFLPYSDHTYSQAPYEECTKERYEALAASLPKSLPWDTLMEDHDETTSSQEMACTGDKCEIVGL